MWFEYVMMDKISIISIIIPTQNLPNRHQAVSLLMNLVILSIFKPIISNVISLFFFWHACFLPFYYRDDVIKLKYFPRYWPFVRGIHQSPVNSPHKGQWRGALMFSLICVWINGWVNNREAGDLRHYRAHYDVTRMTLTQCDAIRHHRPSLYSLYSH